MDAQQHSAGIGSRRRAEIGPLLVGLLLFGLAWLVLDLERRRAADEVRAEVEVAAEQIEARLSVWLEDRLDVLEQFARFRGEPEGAGEAAFRREAGVFISRVRGFKAINWVDADGVIAIVEPEFENAPALGRDLRVHPQDGVRRAVGRSLDTLLPSRTPWIDLYQGGSGFSVYWPVETPGATYGGIVNGVFDLDQLIAHALPDLRVGGRQVVALTEADGTRIFGSGELDDALAPFRVEQTIAFVDRPLRLLVQPAALPAGQMLGASYLLLLCVSAILALAMAVLTRGYLLRQAALSRQEAYNRLLLDSTSEGLLGVDLLGYCTFCNSAALALLGHDGATDLVGKPGLAWLAEGNAGSDQIVSIELFSAIREGRSFEADRVRARGRDGRRFDVALKSHPVREQGRITGALISFADVTAELREAERAQRLTAVLLEVPEMVALMDPRGGLVFLNPAARSVLGVGDAACEQLNARAFIDPEEVRETVDEILPVLAADNLWRGEVSLSSLDGTRFPAQVVLMRHSDHHGQVYFSAIARDLREERKAQADRNALEEQFREAQRTESLGLLAGSIAHDFNNMLVGVLGNASLALEHLDRADAAWRHVAQVQKATEHAAELVGQLLAYSGRGRFEAHTTDVARLVQEMNGLLRTSVPRRIALDVACASEHGVMADATQLRQLVMNLVTNAADAIPADGSIRVRVEDAHWPGEVEDGHGYSAPSTPGDYVRVRIADDGTGMPAAVLAHVFDPFFTTKEDGKGLGLAAVLGIVRGHDGFMHLTSKPGAGTTFDVYLPQSPEPLTELHAPEPERTPTLDVLEGTVLLVDDEPGVRDYLQTALEAMGMNVLSRGDGEAGLEAFRAHHEKIALVLMDQTMPGLSGDAAWKQMQAIDDEIPALLMSGYDEVRIEGSVQALGFAGFLHKPFRFQELREAVSEALARAPSMS
ncbi:MAG: ATP-binding protein [Pseudomonadales bacterium]|jgi:PAS domain S-box-containing protein|nr:ATP-binding protein [Pseudomonadales bacterium]